MSKTSDTLIPRNAGASLHTGSVECLSDSVNCQEGDGVQKIPNKKIKTPQNICYDTLKHIYHLWHSKSALNILNMYLISDLWILVVKMLHSADLLLKIELLAVLYCLKEKWSLSHNFIPDNHQSAQNVINIVLYIHGNSSTFTSISPKNRVSLAVTNNKYIF